MKTTYHDRTGRPRGRGRRLFWILVVAGGALIAWNALAADVGGAEGNGALPSGRRPMVVDGLAAR